MTTHSHASMATNPKEWNKEFNPRMLENPDKPDEKPGKWRPYMTRSEKQSTLGSDVPGTMVTGFDSYYRMAFRKGDKPPWWTIPI